VDDGDGHVHSAAHDGEEGRDEDQVYGDDIAQGEDGKRPEELQDEAGVGQTKDGLASDSASCQLRVLVTDSTTGKDPVSHLSERMPHGNETTRAADS